ncbi:uncharacterized protein LOC126095649 [Schistocerca cancellata]|uniref:uncharacterized protein LOC126095649 n=1 Tax=Schistocerca cancellata TaxID=274614 RepID=UPI002119A957|nr:uncharacterized protein LOC126095649 [Schistocerca cancellata]
MNNADLFRDPIAMTDPVHVAGEDHILAKFREGKSNPYSYRYVSLCDEYSLPVDFVNKRRPHSFGAGLANWTTPSPAGEQVEVVEAYCDPRDSKAYLEPGEEASGKLYTSPDRDYSQPYTDGSSEAKASDLDDDGVYEDVGLPVEGAEDAAAAATVTACVTVVCVSADSEQRTPLHPAAGAERRNRSPYYYADLFRERDEPEPPPPPLPAPSLRRQQQGYRKCVSLDAAAPSCPASQQRPSAAAGARAYRKSASLDATPLAALLLEAPPSTHQQQQPAPQPGGHAPMPPQHRRVAAYQQVASCSCAGGSATEEPGQPQQATPPLGDGARFSDSDADLDDEYLDMSGQPRARRHIYETAFDCRVDRAAATDDTEDIDRLSNHPALHGFSKPSATPAAAAPGVVSFAPRAGPSDDPSGPGIFTPKDLRRRVHQRRVTLVDDTSLSRDLDSLDLDEDDEEESRPATAAAGAAAGAVGAAPSPPSTAPLPAKFSKAPGAGAGAASGARSAPCLPASAPESGTAAGRLKDARLPVKSLRARELPRREMHHHHHHQNGRPAAGSKFSSTESMATSSSGGSLESIRSSTSEGNRSTSSSDSRRSTSLSSHSSDSSGADRYHLPLGSGMQTTPGSGLGGGVGGGMGRFSNKLHILSPISDKSSQEPASSTETSDNNRNNNSTRASPEDQGGITPTNETNTNTNVTATITTSNGPGGAVTQAEGRFAKRQRAPQNRNLINLMGLHQSSGEAEVQGSDSGISIESRTGHQHHHAAGDFSELPFDMPKLRRRQRQLQLQQQQLLGDPRAPGTATSAAPGGGGAARSSDASSVDLADLPFDMPKLRRRMRNSLGAGLALSSADAGSTESSASSSQGGRRDSQGVCARPGLSLNLGGGDASSSASPLRRPALSLDLPAGVAAQPGSIDVSLPLERQGWYHGALSRVEAENVLRVLREGSYLVRNSESARHDYSLSLKGARGFMHMRIQQNKESGKFILGQFSKPFDNIPEMIQHYTVNQLPIRGAEHMCLLHPVIEQLL